MNLSWLAGKRSDRAAKGSADPTTRLFIVVTGLVIPLSFFFAGAVGMYYWPSATPSSGYKEIPFQAFEQTNDQVTPAIAMATLKGAQAMVLLNTKRSESPFWFLFYPITESDPAGEHIGITSRHTREVRCWRGDTFQELGWADLSTNHGEVERSGYNFVINVGARTEVEPLLCRGTFVGPGRAIVRQWTNAGLNASTEELNRTGGILDGGLVLLPLFALITWIINRREIYLLFAVWIFANLRMGEVSAGTDLVIFGHVPPVEWLSVLRKSTAAMLYISTAAITNALFQEDMNRIGYRWVLRGTQLMCIPLIFGCFTFEYKDWLILLWVSSGVGISLLIAYVVRSVIITRSKVGAWYAAAIMVTLLGNFSEVIAAALGLKSVGIINATSASLISSLFGAVSVAQQLREEHVAQTQANVSLKERERELEVERSKLADTLRASSDWLWEADANMVFTKVSVGKDLETMFAQTIESMQGHSLWGLPFPVVFPAQGTLSLAAAQSRREFADLEFQQSDGNGGMRWVSMSGVAIHDDEGAVVGMRGTGRDISDLKDATERAEKAANLATLNAAKLQGVSALQRDVVWEMNSQGQITSAQSEGGDGDLDGPARVLLGKSIRELPIVRVTGTELDPINDALQRRVPFFDVRLSFVMKPGSVRWYSVSGMPMPPDIAIGDNSYIGIAKDITDFIEQVDKAREDTARLGEMQAAVDRIQIARIIFHELKAPVDEIGAYLASMRRQLVAMENASEETPEAAETWRKALSSYVDKATSAYRHAREGFIDFTTLSRAKLTLQRVELDALLGDVAYEQSSTMRVNGIRLQVSAERFTVMGAPKMLKLVVQSMMRNSMECLLERDVEDPRISLSVVEDERNHQEGEQKHAWIHITDNGGGMSEEVAGQILTEDTVISRKKGGWGFGLAGCKAVIAQQEGRVKLLKNTKEQTTFGIKLKMV